MQDQFDVVVIGAGAAGIAAARRLAKARIAHVVLEARDRVGGRAHTISPEPGLPLDLGCGWLHSADINPLPALFEAHGIAVDRSPAPWSRSVPTADWGPEAQRDFNLAFEAFDARAEAAAQDGVDRPASDLLAPGCRWNPRLDAISAYYNGAELDQVSILDYAAYVDTGVNWRAAEGYGRAVAAFADGAAIRTGCPVAKVRHDGGDLRIETPQGTLGARAVIVTAPTSLLAQGRLAFVPDLPQVRAAAEGLPLGLADKVFLALREADGAPADRHVIGAPDRTDTGSYHLRPLGRPYVEGFFGGAHARALEAEGPQAMARFAIEELGKQMGADFARRLEPLAQTAWAADPWARGAYSHALPGRSGERAVLARPVDGRLFFAGEATSPHAYSTAHGAWESGERAAGEALAALGLTAG